MKLKNMYLNCNIAKYVIHCICVLCAELFFFYDKFTFLIL